MPTFGNRLHDRFKAVPLGHKDVSDHHIIRQGFHLSDAFPSIGSLIDLVTKLPQDIPERSAKVGLVLDHQNARVHDTGSKATSFLLERGC